MMELDLNGMSIGCSLVDSRRDGGLKEKESGMDGTLLGVYNGSEQGEKEVDG